MFFEALHLGDSKSKLAWKLCQSLCLIFARIRQAASFGKNYTMPEATLVNH